MSNKIFGVVVWNDDDDNDDNRSAFNKPIKLTKYRHDSAVRLSKQNFSFPFLLYFIFFPSHTHVANLKRRIASVV